MQGLLSEAESSLLKRFLTEANSEKHIEFECKLFGGNRNLLDRSFIEQCISRIRKNLPETSISHRMAITTPDGLRIEIEDPSNIQKVCVQGNLAQIPYQVVEKVPWVEYLRRETSKSDLSQDTLDCEEFPCRFTLRAELPYNRSYEDIPAKSFVRVLERYSYKKLGGMFRYDIDLVQSGDISDGFQKILAKQPMYEIELEYLGTSDVAQPDKIAEHMEELQNMILWLLQVQQGSPSVLRETDRRRYQEQFKLLHLPFVSPITLMLENLQEDNPINIMKGYTVTDKADGERSILYVADDKKVLRIKMSKEVSWTGLRVKKKEDIGTVLDGEYLEALRVFKVFDILQWRGKSVMRVPLYSEEETSPSRLGYCERFVTSVDLEPGLGYPVPTIETKTFIFAEGVKIFEAGPRSDSTSGEYGCPGL
jgi:hypothetical protein